MKTNIKKDGGFTLVELIVVIAILAILAAVAIPAYSGYIEKANRTGDETLLAAVNKAYASACSVGGTDVYLVNFAKIDLDENKKVDLDTVTPYGAEFGVLYEGNENAAFKVFEGIYFDPTLHVFVEDSIVDYTYGDTKVKIPQSAVVALQNSTFNDIGGTKVAGQVDSVSGLVSWLINDGLAEFAETGEMPVGNTFFAMAYNPAYFESIGLTNEKAAALAQNGTLGDYLANSLVITAAGASSSIDANTATQLLQKDPDTYIDSIKGRLNNAETAQDALAEAALIYGVYTSYVYATDPENAEDKLAAVDGSAGLIAAMTEMQDPEGDFNKYMASQGQSDLNAYLESMQVISNATSDKTVADSVMQEGFTNQELLDLLNGIIPPKQ